MRTCATLLLAGALAAQQAPPAPPVEGSKLPETQKVEEAKPAGQTPEPAAPSIEPWVTGFIDLGYRWRTDVRGSLDTYRSVVDLGSGPKLLGMEVSFADPKRRLFDRAAARAYNWGDDPYSTVSINVSKALVYDFRGSYRNVAYFNALPSFGNPLLPRGVLTSQRSFDIRRRLADFELDLTPGSWLVPYLAYEHSSGYGHGVTTFVAEANEYAVPNRIRDGQDNYRGGARFEFRDFHATLEAGGTTFKDDQEVFDLPGGQNFGNRDSTYLGQRLFLGELQQSYGVRGSSVYTKALLTARLASRADLYGQFLYSRPRSETRYQQFNSGNFVVNQVAFVSQQQFLLTSQAAMPHTSASLGSEVRPFSRTRIVVNWLTDRVGNTGEITNGFGTSNLRVHYNQVDLDAIVDITAKLTLRGGYRRIWGDSIVAVRPEDGLAGLESAALARDIGKGGFTYRPFDRLSISGDVEGASSSQVYFRTSLNDYQRARARLRYQIAASLNLALDIGVLNNQNPTPGIEYDYLMRQSSASLLWSPAAAKYFTVQGSYTHSTLRSDIDYIVPQSFQRERSFYRENAHTADALVDFAMSGDRRFTPRISVGGAFFLSSGTRPTSHYQPLGRLSVPVSKSFSWVSEWRYHGFAEPFYGFESFGAHLITTGIRLANGQ